MRTYVLLFAASLIATGLAAQTTTTGKNGSGKVPNTAGGQTVYNNWQPDSAKADFGGELSNWSKATAGPDEVKIGTQIWATKNLDADRFRNGDPVPEAKTKEEWLAALSSKKPAWCYYDFKRANGAKYGRLYNWYAVKDARGLAPTGWHVPTDNEWESLVYYLGENTAGEKMKSTSGWNANSNGTNECHFNALAASCITSQASFHEEGKAGYWWSATPHVTGHAGYGYQIEAHGPVGSDVYDGYGLSVRCVKD
jgi:uncharacterized protein (TIGR02145 family)